MSKKYKILNVPPLTSNLIKWFQDQIDSVVTSDWGGGYIDKGTLIKLLTMQRKGVEEWFVKYRKDLEIKGVEFK